MSKLGAFLALIGFAAALLTEAVFGLTGLFTHSIGVYPVECEGEVVFGTFCDGELKQPLNPSTFRAFPDRQTVIEWSDDGTTEFKRCTIKDFRNWQCTILTGRGLLIQKTLHDGRLTVSRYDSDMSPRTNVNSWDLVYVSVWDWLRLDLEYEMKRQVS
jgi:hypothetical protein